MSEEGASNSPMIEVDEAAAYFGVTESSDTLHAMMAMPKEQAMVKFFDLLSDIVLRPGDFDFEAASERMQCEGGEIYYLVAGHLGLMSMPDPLLHALGLPDSSGEQQGGSLADIDAKQREALAQLADPMRMMKLFAVAHQTGQSDEVLNYLASFENLLSNVETSVSSLVAINDELDASLDVAGHVLPIPSLASGSAAATTLDVPETTSLPSAPPPEPSASPAPKTAPLESKQEPTSVPLPGAEPTVTAPPPTSAPVAVPSPSVELPKVPVTNNQAESEINIESEKQVARATQDAFSGAFSSELEPEPSPAPAVEESNDGIEDHEPEEEEFVSAAEHFIAADEDGSGALDVEELARATGTSIEEAKELHAEADTDGDGVVTLSEFISSPAAEKTAALPKPVAPVRKPLSSTPTAQPAAEQPPAQRPHPLPQQPPQQGWQQPPPQQGWQQPPPQQGWQQPQQRQGWPQPQQPLVQPTIRSGVHCRGCGIGLDPYWRFCPVCGQQNLGY